MDDVRSFYERHLMPQEPQRFSVSWTYIPTDHFYPSAEELHRIYEQRLNFHSFNLADLKVVEISNEPDSQECVKCGALLLTPGADCHHCALNE